MIIDFKIGDEIIDNFLIKSLDVRKTKNGKNYFSMILCDKSGEVSSKVWEVNEDMLQAFKVGDTIKAKGLVESFASNLQFKITKMKKITLSEEELKNMVESAPIEIDTMYNEILSTIDQMKNKEIKEITKTLLDRHEEKFKVYPAAKTFHHAIMSGLLYHTYSMLINAKKLATTYTYLNTDLLYSGVILHDICKTEEMDCNSINVVESYSNAGQLLGHIIQCICEIDEVSKSLNIKSEVPLLLKHIILAHHYEPEFGSPKYPMIPEGEMLHYLDILDSRMNQMQNAFEKTNENEFSSRVRALDNRNIYHYTLKEEE